MPTRSIELTDHHNRFIDAQLDSGKYRSADEVLVAGLRLLEQQAASEEEQLHVLRRVATEGFESLDQAAAGTPPLDETGLRNLIASISREASRATRTD